MEMTAGGRVPDEDWRLELQLDIRRGAFRPTDGHQRRLHFRIWPGSHRAFRGVHFPLEFGTTA